MIISQWLWWLQSVVQSVIWLFGRNLSKWTKIKILRRQMLSTIVRPQLRCCCWNKPAACRGHSRPVDRSSFWQLCFSHRKILFDSFAFLVEFFLTALLFWEKNSKCFKLELLTSSFVPSSIRQSDSDKQWRCTGWVNWNWNWWVNWNEGFFGHICGSLGVRDIEHRYSTNKWHSQLISRSRKQ